MHLTFSALPKNSHNSGLNIQDERIINIAAGWVFETFQWGTWTERVQCSKTVEGDPLNWVSQTLRYLVFIRSAAVALSSAAERYTCFAFSSPVKWGWNIWTKQIWYWTWIRLSDDQWLVNQTPQFYFKSLTIVLEMLVKMRVEHLHVHLFGFFLYFEERFVFFMSSFFIF